MASKDGWTHERNHDKIALGQKQYRNMEEWSRPCATCGAKFSIHVRQNTTGINSNFGYRNCKEHRGQKVGAAGMHVDNEQLEELRTELKGVQENLDEWASVWKTCYPMLSPFGLAGVDTFAAAVQAMYAKHAETFEELQVLKARLAQYELPAALAQQNKMPWS